MLGGDERDRLAEVADAVDREHGLIGELEAVGLLARARPRASAPRARPAIETASEMSIETMRACACGLRSVWPQSIPAAIEVARVRELALHLRQRVEPRDELADPAELCSVAGRGLAS